MISRRKKKIRKLNQSKSKASKKSDEQSDKNQETNQGGETQQEGAAQ
ncbi:hypothetical protein [Clostridium sp.]|nr:hypothetical protein [Clostridium sp.]